MNALSTSIHQDLSLQASAFSLFSDKHTTAITKLSEDTASLSQKLHSTDTLLMSPQDTVLTRVDIEAVIVQKWQGELDPHIQSHHELKDELTEKFQDLNNIDLLLLLAFTTL